MNVQFGMFLASGGNPHPGSGHVELRSPTTFLPLPSFASHRGSGKPVQLLVGSLAAQDGAQRLASRLLLLLKSLPRGAIRLNRNERTIILASSIVSYTNPVDDV
jgi:hypothetical protein